MGIIVIKLSFVLVVGHLPVLVRFMFIFCVPFGTIITIILSLITFLLPSQKGASSSSTSSSSSSNATRPDARGAGGGNYDQKMTVDKHTKAMGLTAPGTKER